MRIGGLDAEAWHLTLTTFVPEERLQSEQIEELISAAFRAHGAQDEGAREGLRAAVIWLEELAKHCPRMDAEFAARLETIAYELSLFAERTLPTAGTGADMDQPSLRMER